MLKIPLHFPNSSFKHPFTKRGVKTTGRKSRYCINIDWFSFSARKKSKDFHSFNASFWKLERHRKDYNFENVYRLSSVDEPGYYCEIFSDPYVSFIEKDLVIVKFHNKLLYNTPISELVTSVCTMLNLEYNAISRLDIALDMQQLSDPRLTPQMLLRKLCRMELRKVGTSVLYDWQVTRQYQYVTGIRYGKRSSDICGKIYNKTLEMKQQKTKPWITDTWDKAGFDRKKETYRFEITINANKNYVLPETGETFDKRDLNLLNNDRLKSLFKAHFNKFFRFAENRHNRRFDRCEQIDIIDFNKEFDEIVLIKKDNKEASGSYEKGLINTVMKMVKASKNTDHLQYISLLKFINSLIEKYSLKIWFQNKYPDDDLIKTLNVSAEIKLFDYVENT